MLPLLPESFAPALPMAVAYSGGADSTALLRACHARWPGHVRAIHIHHGVQAAADGFAAHCEVVCKQLGVELAVQRVNARAASGESPESAARIARYKAIAAVAGVKWSSIAIKTVAFAQHADDQVETILLALSRGAGLPGLAAMPAHWERDGLIWERPLLHLSAADIRQWLAAQGLQAGQGWVEDPTNADERFTRNRIRKQLLPVLEAAFPQFRETFARSARHAAQAQRLLFAVAKQDVAAMADASGTGLRMEALRAMEPERQANALRHWVQQQGGFSPSTTQLAELQSQIAACSTRGHRIHLKVANGVVRRVGAALVFEARAAGEAN